jgi:hypothetical protein
MAGLVLLRRQFFQEQNGVTPPSHYIALAENASPLLESRVIFDVDDVGVYGTGGVFFQNSNISIESLQVSKEAETVSTPLLHR